MIDSKNNLPYFTFYTGIAGYDILQEVFEDVLAYESNRAGLADLKLKRNRILKRSRSLKYRTEWLFFRVEKRLLWNKKELILLKHNKLKLKRQ
jgi:hypothetical protein